jgi:hypothetical protein
MWGNKVLGWLFLGCSLALVLSPIWHDYGGLWPTLVSVGAGMGFLERARHHLNIAEPPHD